MEFSLLLSCFCSDEYFVDGILVILLMVLGEVTRNETEGEKRGITGGRSPQLPELDFTDDICLLSHIFHNMEKKIERTGKVKGRLWDSRYMLPTQNYENKCSEKRKV
jgi:hypothetical protein